MFNFRLVINARHSEMTAEKTILHHFTYEYLLPTDVDPTTVTASWAPNVQALRITAPRNKEQL